MSFGPESLPVGGSDAVEFWNPARGDDIHSVEGYTREGFERDLDRKVLGLQAGGVEIPEDLKEKVAMVLDRIDNPFARKEFQHAAYGLMQGLTIDIDEATLEILGDRLAELHVNLEIAMRNELKSDTDPLASEA